MQIKHIQNLPMFVLVLSISVILCFAFNIHKISLKKSICINSILIFALSLSIVQLLRPPFRARVSRLSSTVLFDDHWQFSFDQKNWTNVTLPHTPRIELIRQNDQQWQGTCFYAKRLSIEEISSSMILRIEAAMHEADVWIDKRHVARHLGGYLSFDVHLPIDQNQIVNLLIQLRNTDKPGKDLANLGFNYYGGLYRHVWLIKRSQRFYLKRSIRVDYKNVTKAQAILMLRFDVNGNSNEIQDYRARFFLNEYEIYPFDTSQNNQASFLLHNPRLWSPAQPNLYHFTIELYDSASETVIFDQQTISIGIRSFEFHADSQYLILNGEPFGYIVGTNRHQEYPYIGYALSDSAQYRDAYKIKQAGFNLVRCSYYPPSSAFLTACDQLGLLVINSLAGGQCFGNRTFEKNCADDVEQIIDRDYNHPSIVLWEVSFGVSPMRKDFLIRAHQIVKEAKPDGLTAGYIDEGSVYDVFLPARQHPLRSDFDEPYRATKNRILAIAEYQVNKSQSNLQMTKVSPEKPAQEQRNGGQTRLLEQSGGLQQLLNHYRHASRTIRIMGDANCLMFDHKRGKAMEIEESGIMDINRLPKFAFYFYQSQCITCSPMIFIAKYWNDSASQTKVIVYTNCDNVELRLNRVLITDGGKQSDQNATDLLRPPFIFTIDRYIAGRLEAIGFVGGKSVVRTYRSTPGKIHRHLRLTADLSGKPLTRNDVVFIYASVYDENETVITDADDLILFSLSNSDDQVVLLGENPVRAEAGIASILLKTNVRSSLKQITVTAFSSTVKETKAHFTVDIIHE